MIADLIINILSFPVYVQNDKIVLSERIARTVLSAQWVSILNYSSHKKGALFII